MRMREENSRVAELVEVLADLTLYPEIRTNRLVQLFIGPYSSISEVEAQFLGVRAPCGANFMRKNSVFHHLLKMEGLFRKKFQINICFT